MKDVVELQQEVEKGLSELSMPDRPMDLYEPIRYILSLGGKRMRPVSLLMACDLFEGEVESALSPALGIEVFHNFTLVHDDIMDEAPLRRGKATVHHRWNSNVGILSGDAMLVKAYQLLAQCPTAYLPEVLEIFNQTALEVCEGQQYDMDFEKRLDVTIDEYLEMIRLKTAVLLGGSLKIGALIGGASEEDAENLYQFGVHLGVAFQLQDDILDVYADQAKFGKQVGGDIIADKKTALLITAKERATGAHADRLKAILEGAIADPAEKVEAVKEIYDACEVRQVAEAMMQDEYMLARKHFHAVQASEERKNPLLELADSLMVREH